MNDSNGGVSSAQIARMLSVNFPSHVEGASLEWVIPYGAIATRLLTFKRTHKVPNLVVAEFLGIDPLPDISPFAFFGLFNGKVRTDERRAAAIRLISERMGLTIRIPHDYQGAPHLNPRHWRFADDVEGGCAKEWTCFEAALTLADDPEETDEQRSALCAAFDDVRALKGIGDSNLPIALYWARPNRYLALDEFMNAYLEKTYGIVVPRDLTGETYLALVDEVAERLAEDDGEAKTFPDLCVLAWRSKDSQRIR